MALCWSINWILSFGQIICNYCKQNNDKQDESDSFEYGYTEKGNDLTPHRTLKLHNQSQLIYKLSAHIWCNTLQAILCPLFPFLMNLYALLWADQNQLNEINAQARIKLSANCIHNRIGDTYPAMKFYIQIHNVITLYEYVCLC